MLISKNDKISIKNTPIICLLFLVESAWEFEFETLLKETNNMASSVYDDDSSDSNLSQDYALKYCDSFNSQETSKQTSSSSEYSNNINVIHKLINRQV